MRKVPYRLPSEKLVPSDAATARAFRSMRQKDRHRTFLEHSPGPDRQVSSGQAIRNIPDSGRDLASTKQQHPERNS
jgi:hypothetical protein